VLQPTPFSSVPPSSPFPPASSDGVRQSGSAPASAPAPDFAASRAVLARQNETNLQLSKEQLDFLHLVEMNEVSATITEICEFTGVSRPTFYRWRTNPRFSQAFGECIARCVFNDLSIVLRNELQDAMTGDRKAGRHTLKLFLSGRGLYHYDALLAMLNWAGRNTPIPPNGGSPDGHADPKSSAPISSQADTSAAGPTAVAAPPVAQASAAGAIPNAAAPAVTVTAQPPRPAVPPVAPAPVESSPIAAPAAAPEPVAVVVAAPPAPRSSEPPITTAAPLNSAAVERSVPASPASSALEETDLVYHRGKNETFSSPEIRRPQADQPLPPQQVSEAPSREISFCVSHAPVAAGDASTTPREPRRPAPNCALPLDSAAEARTIASAPSAAALDSQQTIAAATPTEAPAPRQSRRSAEREPRPAAESKPKSKKTAPPPAQLPIPEYMIENQKYRGGTFEECRQELRLKLEELRLAHKKAAAEGKPTPLELAAQRDEAERIADLLPERFDETGTWIPRMLTNREQNDRAVQAQAERLLKIELEEEAKREAGRDHVREFVEAAYAGNVEHVRAALARGMDVNVREKRYSATALAAAASAGHAEIVDLLLDAGADPLLKDCRGRIPSLIAIQSGHLDLLQRLCRAEDDRRFGRVPARKPNAAANATGASPSAPAASHSPPA
jgi:hypothetical protein